MVKRFARTDPLFTLDHRSATRHDRQELSEFVFNSLSALGWLPAMAGRICVESCFTRMEQRKRADYFNVKELPNPEWVWADYFNVKELPNPEWEHPLQRESREIISSTNDWHNRTIHCLVLCKTNSTSASAK